MIHGGLGLKTLIAASVAAMWFGSGSLAGVAATGTLDFHADLNMKSLRSASCPPGFPASIECHARTGDGIVPGLGRVTETYSFNANIAAPECGGLVKVLAHEAVFSVAAKGEIHLAVAAAPQCFSADAGLRATQVFSITGGTGIYAGASGSGRVERLASFTEAGAVGVDTWIGTLNVPGLEFDLTPPTLTGATSKSVRIQKSVSRVRVTYSVAARDNTDPSVPVVCKPRPGTRFRVGRTKVHCSATDSSGNQATAAFTITVKRR